MDVSSGNNIVSSWPLIQYMRSWNICHIQLSLVRPINSNITSSYENVITSYKKIY